MSEQPPQAERELDRSEVPDYLDLLRLDDRGIVVAGAGQGIGRQTSHALAQAGARVVCMDYDADAAEHVASEIDGVPIAADARERADIEKVLKTAEARLGRVDGVVDIIGMAKYVPLTSTTDEDWEWTQGMVLRHAFYLTQLGAKMMRQSGGGSMAFVASVSGISSAPLHAAYGAAKAGLMSLVRSAAVELGPKGIRVNAVAPGVVWTPRIAAMLGDDLKKTQEDNSPLRRVAQTSDIAAALLFLMSDLSGYVNGQTLVVDGGVTAKFPFPMEF